MPDPRAGAPVAVAYAVRASLAVIVLAVTGFVRASPLTGIDRQVLAEEQQAHVRAGALARLAETRGSVTLQGFSRRLACDARIASLQVAAVARHHGITLPPAQPPRFHHLSQLSGFDFDRALASVAELELQRHLDRLDGALPAPHDGEVKQLLVAIRPMVAQRAAEARWLSRQRR